MNYRSILSPLSKTNRFYIEPHKIGMPYRKTYYVFGDNDLDFSLLLLSKRRNVEIIVCSQNNLYYNFWNALSNIGVDEFVEFFVSQMPLYLNMDHETLLNEMAEVDSAGSLAAFFLLSMVTSSGTPFGVPKDTTKEKIALSVLKIKKIKKLLERVSFKESAEQDGIYLCMNEIQRNFSNRDLDTLSFKLDDLPSTGNNLVLCNLRFENSIEKIDKFENKFYINA